LRLGLLIPTVFPTYAVRVLRQGATTPLDRWPRKRIVVQCSGNDMSKIDELIKSIERIARGPGDLYGPRRQRI
jgi:hypothetical protein